ncbi:MATE family efflux transporter [Botrimarina sp.]|uniref:MATE family efflux transporter n=1 Tax=Botrimarina sp. TaxID=2795802 RepID=UPI0032EEBD9C
MSSHLVQSPGTLRPLLRLSAPVLAEQVLHLMVGLADLTLTGRFLEGSSFVAAMTVVIYLLWLVGMLFAFVATGATPLIARFTGAGDPRLANRVMNQSISVGAAWAAVLMAIGFPLAGDLIRAMGLDGASADAATRYLLVELCVLPAIMVERVGIACLRGAGDTVSGLLTMMVVNVVNIGVSFALLTGAGGWLEPMGWDGVALGTAAGHVTGAVILLAMLVGGRAGFRLRLRDMKPDPALVRRLLRIGIPGGCEAVLLVLCNLAYLRIVVALGDVEAAAHGVAIQVEALAFMPGGAFQIAASTMAGQYLGAGQPDRATRSVLVACAAAAALMMAMGGVFWFAAEEVIALFVRDKPDVTELAARLLRVISLAMLPLAIGMVLSGALRGAGDTRWALAFTLLSMCLVRIPLASYLAQETVTAPVLGWTVAGAGLGAVGAWCGAATDLFVRATLLSGRFLHGGWREVDV